VAEIFELRETNVDEMVCGKAVSRAYAFIIAFGIDYKELAVCLLL
jgi:hypothetical protein